VKLRLSDDVYWAVLARAGSAKRLSQTVEELLKRALAAEGLESFKIPVPEFSSPSKTQAPGSSSTETPRPAETAAQRYPF
jgi:hypothetical protein